MSSQTFPNGLVLSSSALTPKGIEIIFQNLTSQIFGFTLPNSNPAITAQAYYAVRVGWQPTGQPAWKITEDIVIITAYPLDEPYSKVRDQVYTTHTNCVSLDLNMEYTQVWKIHWTCYGPNAYDRARLIVSSMSLDWVHDYLQSPPPLGANPIYAVASWDRPKYAPELFQGQWWQRADVELNFNELVLESVVVPSALSEQITLVSEDFV